MTLTRDNTTAEFFALLSEAFDERVEADYPASTTAKSYDPFADSLIDLDVEREDRKNRYNRKMFGIA